MIDATHLKAHRTVASLLKEGLFPVVSGAPMAPRVPIHPGDVHLPACWNCRV